MARVAAEAQDRHQEIALAAETAKAGRGTWRVPRPACLRSGLAGQVAQVLARDEVLVGEADSAAEGAALDELDDGVDVAVEAAVAVDERGDLADERVGGADGGCG